MFSELDMGMRRLDNDLDPDVLFKNVDIKSPVLVAVSGGSDSIALLLLSSIWAKKNNVDLSAITIDHGLRAEAAAETAFVAALCNNLDIPHVTLAWDGMKPHSGISEAARVARYQLIEQFADEIGAKSVLVGHQANDQAETLVMRNSRSNGGGQLRGLSGIPSLSILPRGTFLHRPLLHITRQRLKSYLREYDQSWIEDPTNEDLSYERVRIRTKTHDDHVLLENCSRFANTMGRLRKSMVERSVEFLEDNLDVSNGPVYALKRKNLINIAPQVQELVLSICVSVAGGAKYFQNVKRLALEIGNGICTKKTLGGAVIEAKKDTIYFYRENRNIFPVTVKPGEAVIWDNRFLIENFSREYCVCMPYSAVGENVDLSRKIADITIKPRAALATSLCLQFGNDAYNLPHVEGFSKFKNVSITPVYQSIEYFCPEYDFALFDFLERFKHEKTLENML